MSEYLADRIKKAAYFRLDNNDGVHSRPRYVIGFDSEADTSTQGQPMLFQFSLPNTPEDAVLLYEVDETPYSGLRVFLGFLDKYCTSRDYGYLIYVWNLAYELTQLFRDLPRELLGQDKYTITPWDSQTNEAYPWTIHVLNSNRQMLKFTRGKNITVNVLDGRAFYVTSLDKAARMLGLGEKYAADGIERSMFTRADLTDPDFIKYAKRDAFITRRIGEYISQQHDIYRIPTTVSAPHLAATIFKTHFLEGELARLSTPLEQAGLSSYHGGKNGFYLDGPYDFPSVWSYDITSAYPEAMRQLPDLDHSSWKHVQSYKAKSHALYCVTGRYKRCTYRGMQSHNGKWPSEGHVEQTWITSYELDAMVQRDEFSIESLTGYEFIGEQGGGLQRYVDRFFQIKSVSTGPERETAKLLLNSLYGKFFQKQPVGAVGHYDLDNRRWITTNPDDDWDYEAGGLYHPPVASLITGYVRARIHGLEHQYEAIMTSTDGLFGFVPPDPKVVGKKLGQLTAVQGRLRIWRERLYVFEGVDGKNKIAMHGFRGTLPELKEIPLARGSYHYAGKQMITLKQSNMMHDNQRYKPGTFVVLPYTINI